MIHRLTSSDPRFHDVHFRSGLNLILADRTAQSDEHDSRNGLGKTSLVHLIHFCLGGDLPVHLSVPEVIRSEFVLEIDIGGARAEIMRSPRMSANAVIGGEWQPPMPIDESSPLRIEDLNTALGQAVFGLSNEGLGKYAPSFRALISYFARRGHDAFVSPLKHFHSQPGYQQQILHAFLTGLAWEYPRDQRLLHEEAEALRALRRAVKDGALEAVVGSAGEIQARRVQATRRLDRLQEQLDAFRVHPRYRALQDEANDIAGKLRELSNMLARDRRLLSSYIDSVAESSAGMSGIQLEQLYSEVELALPELVRETLDSVQAFHRQLRKERSEYLQREITALRERIEEHEARVRTLEDRRNRVLEMLRTHGSAEEFRALQDEARSLERTLGEISEQLKVRNKIDQGADDVRTRRVERKERARRAFKDDQDQRDRLVALFDHIWEDLYGVGGRLIMDVTDSGYSFDWEVEREGSEGVNKMKIFAHDLAIAVRWAEQNGGPGFLMHDSTIWDGVDERQIAAGLRVAGDLAAECGLQYITSLNTDVLPPPPESASWDKAVVLRLTDATNEGRLFGFAF